MSSDLKNILRGVAALAALVVLIFVVWGYVSDFRDAGNTAPETTSTVEPSQTPDGAKAAAEGAKEGAAESTAGKVVIVTIDGLNFRTKPESDAKAIRGLEKGEKLTLVKTQDGWYQVKDAAGKVGWISSNPQYSKIEE